MTFSETRLVCDEISPSYSIRVFYFLVSNWALFIESDFWGFHSCVVYFFRVIYELLCLIPFLLHALHALLYIKKTLNILKTCRINLKIPTTRTKKVLSKKDTASKTLIKISKKLKKITNCLYNDYNSSVHLFYISVQHTGCIVY